MNVMTRLVSSLSLLLFLLLAGFAFAEDKVTRIQFERGKSEAIVQGTVKGRDGVLYKLNAKDGQFLRVEMLPGVKGADFNIFIPGRAPGEEAFFSSMAGGRKYLGQLYKTGDHSILVYQNRAAARRGEVADFKMLVSITDQPPVEEEKPATGPVPKRVIDDCLAALRKQIPDKLMKVVSASRGETSFIVDISVEGVPKPWRCYHDGTECTGTEYQGEG